MLALRREGAGFVLAWSDGENRFRDESIAAWNAALDEVDAAEGAKALVTTGAGKFYSNGLDLDWALREARERVPDFVLAVLGVLGRVLTLACPTVAAVNGHAFGAGAQLAVAHDRRLMRAERGSWCLPEIDLRAPLHGGMTALLRARLPAQALHEAIATGRRFGGEAARAAGVVDLALAEAELLPKAVELAAELAPKAHPVLRRLKSDLYAPALAALREREGFG